MLEICVFNLFNNKWINKLKKYQELDFLAILFI